MTIWKYEIPIADDFVLHLPEESRLLCIQVDNKTGSPCIWAVVDPDLPEIPLAFHLHGTGYPIINKTGQDYVGTFQIGPFVWHLFRET